MPDGLEAKLVKLAAHIIMYPLADLFNSSLSTCSIPPIWKCARVTPFFKGGDPSDVNNYRPICIICTIAKIFDKLIFNQLSQYINQFNILSPSQSDFRPSFFTTTAHANSQVQFLLIFSRLSIWLITKLKCSPLV